MTATLYWKTALPYYLKFHSVSTLGWVGPLAITLASTMWLGLTKHRLAVDRTGMEFAFAFGGFFFLLTLLDGCGRRRAPQLGCTRANCRLEPTANVEDVSLLRRIVLLCRGFSRLSPRGVAKCVIHRLRNRLSHHCKKMLLIVCRQLLKNLVLSR